jgi:hypothetical protein
VRRIADDNQIVPHLVRYANGNDRLYTHSMNTAAYAIALGSRRDELDEEALRLIGLGALAHDVGLANVDPGLLGRKESALTDGEHAFLAKHPQRGAGLLLDAGITDPVIVEIATSHHEMASHLPLHLQIVQLADTSDTLTNRPGRTDTGAYRALYTLRETTRGRYDPDLPRDFVLMLGGWSCQRMGRSRRCIRRWKPLSQRSARQPPNGERQRARRSPIPPADRRSRSHNGSAARGAAVVRQRLRSHPGVGTSVVHGPRW